MGCPAGNFEQYSAPAAEVKTEEVVKEEVVEEKAEETTEEVEDSKEE